MDIIERQRAPIKMNGHHWTQMETNETNRTPIDIREHQYTSMDFNEHQ